MNTKIYYVIQGRRNIFEVFALSEEKPIVLFDSLKKFFDMSIDARLSNVRARYRIGEPVVTEAWFKSLAQRSALSKHLYPDPLTDFIDLGTVLKAVVRDAIDKSFLPIIENETLASFACAMLEGIS